MTTLLPSLIMIIQSIIPTTSTLGDAHYTLGTLADPPGGMGEPGTCVIAPTLTHGILPQRAGSIYPNRVRIVEIIQIGGITAKYRKKVRVAVVATILIHSFGTKAQFIDASHKSESSRAPPITGGKRHCSFAVRNLTSARPHGGSLQREATRAIMEATKWLKLSDSGSQIGDPPDIASERRVTMRWTSALMVNDPVI